MVRLLLEKEREREREREEKTLGNIIFRNKEKK